MDRSNSCIAVAGVHNQSSGPSCGKAGEDRSFKEEYVWNSQLFECDFGYGLPLSKYFSLVEADILAE